MWRSIMALPDGTEIRIFWPSHPLDHAVTISSAHRVSRDGHSVAQYTTLGDVIELVRGFHSDTVDDAFPHARVGNDGRPAARHRAPGATDRRPALDCRVGVRK